MRMRNPSSHVALPVRPPLRPRSGIPSQRAAVRQISHLLQPEGKAINPGTGGWAFLSLTHSNRSRYRSLPLPLVPRLHPAAAQRAGLCLLLPLNCHPKWHGTTVTTHGHLRAVKIAPALTLPVTSPPSGHVSTFSRKKWGAWPVSNQKRRNPCGHSKLALALALVGPCKSAHRLAAARCEAKIGRQPHHTVRMHFLPH
jgi:hypothetical protein